MCLWKDFRKPGICSMSSDLKEAYELKELYKKWQRNSKEEKDFTVVKAGLLDFYRKLEETQNSAFLKAIKTFKNWQFEILNLCIWLFEWIFRRN